jgi:hypothetical protein
MYMSCIGVISLCPLLFHPHTQAISEVIVPSSSSASSRGPDIEFVKPKYKVVVRQGCDVAFAAGVTFNTHFQQSHKKGMRRGHWQAFLMAVTGQHDLSCDECKELLGKVRARQPSPDAFPLLDIAPPAPAALVAVDPGWERTPLFQIISIL